MSTTTGSARATGPPPGQRLGLPDQPTVLFVGRIQPLKGIDVAIDAFRLVRRVVPSARMVVVGGPSGDEGAAEVERLRAKVADRRPRRRWSTGGSQLPHHDLPAVYQAADVLLFPSRSETFGLVAAEAQACGIPVVASSAGGLAYAVEDGESGYLIDSWDPEQYAEHVIDVAHRPRTGQQALQGCDRGFRAVLLGGDGAAASRAVCRDHGLRPARFSKRPFGRWLEDPESDVVHVEEVSGSAPGDESAMRRWAVRMQADGARRHHRLVGDRAAQPEVRGVRAPGAGVGSERGASPVPGPQCHRLADPLRRRPRGGGSPPRPAARWRGSPPEELDLLLGEIYEMIEVSFRSDAGRLAGSTRARKLAIESGPQRAVNKVLWIAVDLWISPLAGGRNDLNRAALIPNNVDAQPRF